MKKILMSLVSQYFNDILKYFNNMTIFDTAGVKIC